MAAITPTLAGRFLGEMLERMRNTRQLRRGEVAAYLGKTSETIRRWEIGFSCPDISNLRQMCQLYEATGEEMARLTALAAESKSRDLVEGVNVPAHLRLLVESDHTAEAICGLELLVIPGLLQTPQYLRAVQDARIVVPPNVAHAVQLLRAKRQRIVFSRNPLPRLEFIIGSTALSYIRHLPGIYDDQVAHLREISRLPNVDIRIVSRLHAGVAGSFTLITPRDRGLGSKPFVCVESIAGLHYVEQSRVVTACEETWTAVRHTSATLEEYLDDAG